MCCRRVSQLIITYGKHQRTSHVGQQAAVSIKLEFVTTALLALLQGLPFAF